MAAKVFIILFLFINTSCIHTKNNNIKSEIIGYITINNNINSIVKGHDKKDLNRDLVGAIIDNKNIILAGHNSKKVFNNITKLKLNDTVYLTINDITYKYKVIKITKLDKNEFLYYDNSVEELSLITCINNNKKRLIVTAKKVN